MARLPFDGRIRVTSPYGYRVDPITGAQGAWHGGLDLVGEDYVIRAAMGGTVVVSQIVEDRGNATWEWGNYVCIRGDDGRYYYYCHMAQRLVDVGKRVKAGDHLGIEGNTGYSFGSHCHFEVRNGANVSVDPSGFIGAENKVGTYGIDYRDEAKKRFGLSEDTMRYLDRYKYAADLFRKLVESE